MEGYHVYWVCRLQSCQQVQSDIDKKIKWATDATEAQQKAQSELESNIAKLQKDLKAEVCQTLLTLSQHVLGAFL